VIAAVSSAVLLGVEGRRILVEVHVSDGLPGFTIVGLPDAACREARDRVRAALLSSGLPWSRRRVTVNLAPSGVRKAGAGLDLPIAVGSLVASGEIDPAAVAGCSFIGELGLDGTLRSVPGVLPLVAAVTSDAVVVPWDGVREARLVGGPVVRTARTLRELVEVLRGGLPWPEPHAAEAPGGSWPRPGCAGAPGSTVGAATGPAGGPGERSPDLSDVRGQLVGRRAIEVGGPRGPPHHN
jgi:magnesium chelatase family protein